MIETYSYLTDHSCVDKKKQSTQKKYILKREIKLENYKNCQEANKLENEIYNLEINFDDVIKQKIKMRSKLTPNS